MIFFKKILFIALAILIYTGCSITQPLVQKSTFIVMKTPVFRYADQGFINKGKDETKIEIYASGTPVMKLEIGSSQVCSGSGLFSCLSKRDFNKRFLSADYPDDTLEKIFRGEKIFAGLNTEYKNGGFVQSIKKDSLYEINYSVFNGSIIFRDTINNILIKVRDS